MGFHSCLLELKFPSSFLWKLVRFLCVENQFLSSFVKGKCIGVIIGTKVCVHVPMKFPSSFPCSQTKGALFRRGHVPLHFPPSPKISKNLVRSLNLFQNRSPIERASVVQRAFRQRSPIGLCIYTSVHRSPVPHSRPKPHPLSSLSLPLSACLIVCVCVSVRSSLLVVGKPGVLRLISHGQRRCGWSSTQAQSQAKCRDILNHKSSVCDCGSSCCELISSLSLSLSLSLNLSHTQIYTYIFLFQSGCCCCTRVQVVGLLGPLL